jgi:membrane-associated phospholipid phosphatase
MMIVMTAKTLEKTRSSFTSNLIRFPQEHPVIASFAFWGLYLLSFFLVEHIDRNHYVILHSRADDFIPFVKYAVVFYDLWFLCLAGTFVAFVFFEERRRFLHMYFTIALCMFSSILFYLLVPTAVELRPSSVAGNDLFAFLVRMIWQADNSCNVCPSLHVSTAFLMDCVWQRSNLLKESWQKHAVRILDLGIILSTVLLKQHSLIDVFAGILWGLACLHIVTGWMKRRFSFPF